MEEVHLGDSQSSGGEGSQSEESEEKEKEFQLKLEGVLTKTEEINWDSVKNEVELLYSSIPGLTITLYEEGINNQDVLNFNQEYDNLAKIIKDENKEQCLSQMSKLYEFLPKFAQNLKDQNLYQTLLNTKNNVFKAYSKLDGGNWEEIGNDIKNAIDVYSKLLTDTSIEKEKQYNINKCYVMLNEMQNAIASQDTSIFLIKYKNLIEEIDSL